MRECDYRNNAPATTQQMGQNIAWTEHISPGDW